MSITMRNTKAEMLAEIDRLNEELVAAKAAVPCILEMSKLFQEAVAAAPVVVATQPKTHMPLWQRERALAMAAAREQAMRSRSVVRV